MRLDVLEVHVNRERPNGDNHRNNGIHSRNQGLRRNDNGNAEGRFWPDDVTRKIKVDALAFD